MKPKNKNLLVAAAVIVSALSSTNVFGAWVSTGFTAVNIRMDNGVTYFYPDNNGSLSYPLGGNCMYNRLELRDTGDRFNSVENGKRIMALILSARMSGKLVSLGYDDTDGPACRVAQVIVQW